MSAVLVLHVQAAPHLVKACDPLPELAWTLCGKAAPTGSTAESVDAARSKVVLGASRLCLNCEYFSARLSARKEPLCVCGHLRAAHPGSRTCAVPGCVCLAWDWESPE